MAEQLDITVYRRTDRTLRFVPAGDPVDINGWTIALTVKQLLTDTATVLTASGTIVSPSTGGIFTIALTKSATNLAPGTYFFDVRRTNSGSERVLAYGRFYVRAAVRN